ncbi:MarR family transcriptional regulator [Solirubrobacter pauli]|uniref:MarR family transcriptional regulator n=1 Tax=Solirubrobacter pauli TaxID=166793 RepID=A0A660LAV3_9ACTN|nr:MarR family transcriptional regulator [Solirubrobacter pauli]RKQ92142.1 MarR family transcriptional regulator [Solirubrobacter pauli]
MAERGSPSRLSDDELAAWQGLLRANATLQRTLDADLQRSHQLSANAYDVLIQLGLAPEKRLRMRDLADEVLMSHNGLSGIVAQLESAGLVVRTRDAKDGRVVYAGLTPEGQTVLRSANRAHLARVRELFLDRLSAEQLQQLRAIWDAVDPALVAGRPRP